MPSHCAVASAITKDFELACYDPAAKKVSTAPIEVDGYRPQLRTGIHLGRPRKLGGDYFGVDVNIAARLCDAAKPGEILVSDRVLEQLAPGAAEAKRRRFSAKGAPRGMDAYAVRRSGVAQPGRPA